MCEETASNIMATKYHKLNRQSLPRSCDFSELKCKNPAEFQTEGKDLEGNDIGRKYYFCEKHGPGKPKKNKEKL